jgi:hypothetical protein
MFDINLVPEVQHQKQEKAKRNTLATFTAIGIVGVSVLTLVVLGSLKVASTLSLNSTKNKIAKVEAESEQYKELEKAVLSLEAGLAGVKSTLNGQNDWTLLLPHLEIATPGDVSYKNMIIEGQTINANLAGRQVESVARFIESYKNYRVLVMKGAGTPQETVKFTFDGVDYATSIRGDGTWVYALKTPTDSDFTISLGGAKVGEIIYLADTKSLSSVTGVDSQIINLFTEINTKQYSKEGSTVTFDATFKVATEALW